MAGSAAGVRQPGYRVGARVRGRVLRQVGDPALTEAVLAEAGREIEAVAAAERGELSCRAVRAVVPDRVDASPVQVVAADRLLAEHPLGCPRLLTRVDPAAACVAAAHWTAAAADVAADAARLGPAEVFSYAGDIEGVVQVPGLVVEAILGEDAPPREVVLEPLADATAVCEGRHPDPAGLADLVDGRPRARRPGCRPGSTTRRWPGCWNASPRWTRCARPGTCSNTSSTGSAAACWCNGRRGVSRPPRICTTLMMTLTSTTTTGAGEDRGRVRRGGAATPTRTGPG